MSHMNRHPFVMDGHNLHNTMDIMLQVHHMGLYLVTLPSHTSHALQLLDVASFKPFTTFLEAFGLWPTRVKGAKKRGFGNVGVVGVIPLIQMELKY